MFRLPIFASVLVMCGVLSESQAYELGGELGVDYRYFPDDAQFSEQLDLSGFEYYLKPRLRIKQGDTSFVFEPVLRKGRQSGYRDYFDVGELYWSKSGRNSAFRFGFVKEFWGVTESRNIVNLFNQVNLIEDFDQKNKLGQFTVNYSYIGTSGEFSVYWLPYFRKRDFPDQTQRFLLSPPVAKGNSSFEGTSSSGVKDIAVKYSSSFGLWDIGASYFRGLDREPWLLSRSTGDSSQAVYLLTNRFNLESQYTGDNLLVKSEVSFSRNNIDNYFSSVLGLEYTFYQVFDSNLDVGLLAEYLYSDRRDISADLFEDDFFTAVRFGFNDVGDSDILIGVLVDQPTREKIIQFEFNTRIKNSWNIELKGTVFSDTQDTLMSLSEDSLIRATISYHF